MPERRLASTEDGSRFWLSGDGRWLPMGCMPTLLAAKWERGGRIQLVFDEFDAA